MSVIQTHAKDITNGVQGKYYRLPLAAYIVPPSPGKLNGPAAYVWVTNGNNERQTFPRGQGFRKTRWTVTIWIMAADNASNPNADVAFANLLDEITEAWVTAPMPVTVTDPDTGRISQITFLGESFAIEQSPVHALADQRLLLYEAVFRFTVDEVLQP